MVAHHGCRTRRDHFPTAGEPPKHACHVIGRGLIRLISDIVPDLTSGRIYSADPVMNHIIPQAGDKSCAHHGAHKAGHRI